MRSFLLFHGAYNIYFLLYRLNQLRSALIFLEKALAIEQRHAQTAAKADTHLNMCAVLSQLGRHDHAMLHAHQAIIIVQSTLLMNHLPHRRVGKGSKGHDEDKLTEGMEATKEFKDRVTVLTIAYHNLAVEQEFMHMVSVYLSLLNLNFSFIIIQYDEAVSSYKMARDFSHNYLGPEDSISINMQNILTKAETEIEAKKSRLENHEKKLN